MTVNTGSIDVATQLALINSILGDNLYKKVCGKMFCGLAWSALHTSRELKSLHTRGCGVWNRILALTEDIYCTADRFRSLLTLVIYTSPYRCISVYSNFQKLWKLI